MKALSTLTQSHSAKKWISMLLCIATVLALASSAFADVTVRGKGNSSASSGSGLQWGAIPIKRVSASSEFSETKKGYTMSYPAKNAVDGKLETAWIEGAEGPGAGGYSWITLEFDGTYDVSRIDFWLGWAVAKEQFEKNMKPATLKVKFSDGTTETLDFDDWSFSRTIREPQSWRLSSPVRASWVQFTIMGVYRGWDKIYDTCISEIACFE